MNCPKCNKPMRIIAYDSINLKSDNTFHKSIIGRCEDCDFDARWTRIEDVQTGKIAECDLKRYFFG